MKPDWDKLGQKYADSESVMIVDVDCTVHEQTCAKVGVKGYPTIKYYMAGDKKGKDYQQGRDYNSLSSFVEATLNKPMCNVKTLKGCQPNEKAYIEKNADLDLSGLKEALQAKEEEGKVVKKERSEAQKEMKEKEKEWKKKEKGHTMAKSILKQLIKEKEKA